MAIEEVGKRIMNIEQGMTIGEVGKRIMNIEQGMMIEEVVADQTFNSLEDIFFIRSQLNTFASKNTCRLLIQNDDTHVEKKGRVLVSDVITGTEAPAIIGVDGGVSEGRILRRRDLYHKEVGKRNRETDEQRNRVTDKVKSETDTL